MRKEYEAPEIVVEKFTVDVLVTTSTSDELNQEDSIALGSLEEF